MAISPNGYIAREDGDEDWLPSEGWDEFLLLAKKFNNIVMGRETYEQVTKRYKDYNFNNVDCDHKLIVTHKDDLVVPEGYTVVHSPQEAIEHLQAKELPDLLLIGGGNLNSSFMKRGLINEIQLTINPYIIGSGRSFVSPDQFDLSLELIDSTVLSKGRVQIRYKVAKLAQ